MTAEQLPGTPAQRTPPHDPIAHDPALALAGVSRDGKRLLLVNASGAEFTLPVDSRLAAALRGDSARLGQLEIEMESTLRPRDIQARIRAGESPESVAKAAQTTIEKIMPYASPVLAEREHITQRAQRSSLRRPGTAVRTLGDAIGVHLRGLNIDPAALVWDAWRREDGRWHLTAKFAVPGRKGTATFSFDAPGNFVTLEDDHAQWLVGDAPTPTAPAPPAPQAAPAPRLTSVPRAAAAAGAGDPADREPTIDLAETAAVVRSLEPEQPIEAFLDDDPAAVERPHPPEDQPRGDDAAEVGPAADEPAGRRSIRKSRGRASVPTWDEIMFGGGTQE